MYERFNGMTIIEDESMVDRIPDWSQCRSPSRAKRRMERGFKTRFGYITVPKKEIIQFHDRLVMHPRMARDLRAQIRNSGEAVQTL